MWLETSRIEKRRKKSSKHHLTIHPATPLVLLSYTEYRPDMDVMFGGVADRTQVSTDDESRKTRA